MIESNLANPTLTAVVQQQSGAIAGQSLTLECVVSGNELLGGSITYVWSRAEMVLGGETSMAYTFIATAQDHGVTYYCTATVNSRFLAAPISSSRGSRVINVLGKLVGVYLVDS